MNPTLSITRPGRRIDQAPDSVLQQLNVEIDQERVTQAGQLQARERLCGMDRQKALNALNLDQNEIVDDEVDSVPGFDSEALEVDRQVNLPLERNFSLSELVGEAPVVG